MSAENWNDYTIAYKNAANILLDKLLKRERPFYTQFAIIFLFRHYIELMLKEIILNNRELTDKEYSFTKSHDIYKLWNDCRELLEEADRLTDSTFTQTQEYHDEVTNAYNLLEDGIKKFATIDPDSERFRYPVDRVGKPRKIDSKKLSALLKELPELMKQISDTLEAISSGIYQILQDKYDGIAERDHS
jgi:hypothetical protein